MQRQAPSAGSGEEGASDIVAGVRGWCEKDSVDGVRDGLERWCEGCVMV